MLRFPAFLLGESCRPLGVLPGGSTLPGSSEGTEDRMARDGRAVYAPPLVARATWSLRGEQGEGGGREGARRACV